MSQGSGGAEPSAVSRGEPADVDLVVRVAVAPPDGPVEHRQFRYVGRWWRQADKALCRYEDKEAASVVTLKVAAGALTLLRQGDITCRQEFRAGEAGRALYRTPYGVWPLTWRCRQLDVRFFAGAKEAIRDLSLPDLAVIRFSYEQELGGQYLGLYEVLLEVGAGRRRGEEDADRRQS